MQGSFSIISKILVGSHDKPEESTMEIVEDNELPKGQGRMGFKDMESFNDALLAKQFWRLFTRPASLVTKIIKEKYFKHGDLLSANVKGHLL